MALDMDPDHINDADRQLKARIAETSVGYAAANTESKKLNKQRAELRAKIKELGVRTDSYQTAIHVAKDLTPAEGKVFVSDLMLLLEIFTAQQQDLFAEEQIRAAKRVEKAQQKAASKPRTPAEIDAANADNPRSDPANGGAKPMTGVAPLQENGEPWPDDKVVAERDAAEQAEGDSALKSLAPKMSQSQKAAQKRAAAKLDG